MRLLRTLAVLAYVAATLVPAAASAQQASPGSAPPISILDGQRFIGEFVPSGQPSGRPDEFVFMDGNFHSRECLEWGFTPGPYWVRIEGGRVHFLARLTSEENGVMTYEGSVAGAEMDARIEWIRPRWYWTMRRDFRFQGESIADAAVDRR
jgi:hypothetical protein